MAILVLIPHRIAGFRKASGKRSAPFARRTAFKHARRRQCGGSAERTAHAQQRQHWPECTLTRGHPVYIGTGPLHILSANTLLHTVAAVTLTGCCERCSKGSAACLCMCVPRVCLCMCACAPRSPSAHSSQLRRNSRTVLAADHSPALSTHCVSKTCASYANPREPEAHLAPSQRASTGASSRPQLSLAMG